MDQSNRRTFLKSASASTLGLVLAGCTSFSASSSPTESSRTADTGGTVSSDPDSLYKISLAEWSLHRTLFNGELDHLDFAPTAKKDFGIEAVEYVNQFFMDKAKDEAYLREMKTRAEDAGVDSLLIMCDGEGALGAPDEQARIEAVQNHHKWVEAAQFLGCHAIRVNAQSEGSYEEQQQRAADGLRRLCEFAADYDIEVLVENHGGLSSNAAWLSGVMERVDHPLVGTLPDFGNFCIDWEGEAYSTQCAEEYDRYQGVRELMPYAEAVSAKSHVFNEDGEEANTDYYRMMDIVVSAGYNGHVGIEYEGDELSEPEGIRATKRLLERVRQQMATAQG